MKLLLFCSLLLLVLSSGCDRKSSQPSPTASPVKSLLEAREGFQTRLVRKTQESEPATPPPPKLFSLIKYTSSAGSLSAYVSPNPGDGKKHPVIIWLVGGFGNGIDAGSWEKGPAENDQSASVFREAGLLMMYPSLRGGNDKQGFKEGFYGEVDDVIAATDYLCHLDYIDPNRIYLGGHSTGGTLALLVAESTNRFRAVFSFGPVADVEGYGQENLPFDISVEKELELRAPIKWLRKIQNPTYVFEGTRQSNISSLKAMARANHNINVKFYPVVGVSHFSIIQPVSRVIAAKILADDGSTASIVFTEKELVNAVK